MRFFLTTLKARKLAMIIMLLLIGVWALILARHYESAEVKMIRELAGAPESTAWPIYVAIAIGASLIYMVVARIVERRLQYVGYILPFAMFLSLYLLDKFWWGWIVALAVMLAIIVLIGWLYPSTSAPSAYNDNGGQT